MVTNNTSEYSVYGIHDGTATLHALFELITRLAAHTIERILLLEV